jgi:hypothetical protein
MLNLNSQKQNKQKNTPFFMTHYDIRRKIISHLSECGGLISEDKKIATKCVRLLGTDGGEIDFEGWTIMKEGRSWRFRVGTRMPIMSMEDGQVLKERYITDKTCMKLMPSLTHDA